MPSSTLVKPSTFKTLKAQLSIAATSAAFVVLGTVSTAAPARAVTLWYNGDLNGQGGLANEFNTEVNDAAVYENFNVPTDEIWVIDTVFSNNQMNFTGVNQANWEIRTGVSAGNGGTLVAGATGATATQTPTGRSDFYPEYRIQVSGLNVTLTPGTYWLSAAPIGFGSGRSGNSTDFNEQFC